MSSCSITTSPDESEIYESREIGYIGHYRVIDAPDTVDLGVPFVVTVTTFGSSSCTRPDGAEVQILRNYADVTPYDIRKRGNVTCTRDIAPQLHEVQFRFRHPGEGVIRVRGIRFEDETPYMDSVEKRIIVRP